MSLNINRALVKVKHLIHFNNKQETNEDLLYELVAHLEATNSLNKEFQVKDVWKDVLCRPHPEGLNHAFDILCNSSFLEKRSENKRIFYKLIQHPWMSN